MGGVWNALWTVVVALREGCCRLGRNLSVGGHAMDHLPTLQEVTEDLFRLLHDVAPERANELARELDAVRPTVIIDDQEIRHSITANPEQRTIRVGIPCLKRQLAMA